MLGGGPVPGGGTAPQGLSWSWELDFETLMAALNEPAPWNRPPRRPTVGGGAPITSVPGTSVPGNSAAGSSAAGGSAAGGSAAGAAAGSSAGDGGGGGGAEDQDAVLDALLAAEVREVPLTVAAGRVAECLPTGPGLAGWLASADAAGLEDGALAGVAASWRRVASWAQAGELAAVAQIASRPATRR